MSQGDETVTNPKKTANIFNEYFSTIAEKVKAKIKFSSKLFDEFYHYASKTSLFLNLTTTDEVVNVISSLNKGKTLGANSLPAKIIKLWKNDVLLKMAHVFNLSFIRGVFSSEHLKLLKLYQFTKRDQNWNAQTIEQYIYNQILTNSWQSLMYIRFMIFLRNISKYSL